MEHVLITPHTAGETHGDTMLNLVVAAGYLSSLIDNLRLSGYLGRHHPEILTDFRNEPA